MKKFCGILLVVLISVLFFQYCGSKEENVAKVGKTGITKSQYINELTKYYGQKPSYQDIDLERKKNILDSMIKRKVKLLEAYDNDLDEDKDFITNLDMVKKRAMTDKYFEQVIVNTLVPPKTVDEYLQRQGVQFVTNHIQIGFKGSNLSNNRTREEAKLLADQAVKEAKSGQNFTDLVLKYSDDPSAKNNKGILRFKWGEMLRPVQDVVWNMKVGEISDAVETPYGFYIIRLDDRRETPNYKPDLSPDNVLRTKYTLLQAKGDSGRIMANKHLAELKEKYHMFIDTANVKTVSTLVNEKIKNEAVTVESFDAQQKKLVLAKWNGGSLTWGFMLDAFKDRLTRAVGRFRQANLLQQDVEQYANQEILVKAASKYDLEDDPDIKRQLSGYMEDRLSQLVEKKEVADKTTVSDEEVQKYYEANTNKFMKEEELEIWQISVKDENLAKKVAAKARAGSEFTALAKKYSEDKTSVNKGGYIGFRSINSLGPVGQEAFSLGPNKIGGPVKNRSGWMIFKTGKKNEKSVRPFKDVENQARNMVRSERIKENRAAWEKNLEQKYPVTTNEELLKQI